LVDTRPKVTATLLVTSRLVGVKHFNGINSGDCINIAVTIVAMVNVSIGSSRAGFQVIMDTLSSTAE